eukprot:jgi/Bigna1/84491/fgenesh1_pg.142_\
MNIRLCGEYLRDFFPNIDPQPRTPSTAPLCWTPLLDSPSSHPVFYEGLDGCGLVMVVELTALVEKDWERRWDVLPFVCWMIFVFAGCAITNPSVMALKNGYSVNNQAPHSSSNNKIRLSDKIKVESQPAGAMFGSKASGRGGTGAGSSSAMENERSFAKDQASKVHSGRAASSRPAKRAPPEYGYHTFVASRSSGGTNTDTNSKSSDSQLNLARREAVRQAFKHAWTGYETHAFGHDEVRPTTNETNDSWGGFGITLFDSLDTMLLMGLDDEYERALGHVRTINFNKDYGHEST